MAINAFHKMCAPKATSTKAGMQVADIHVPAFRNEMEGFLACEVVCYFMGKSADEQSLAKWFTQGNQRVFHLRRIYYLENEASRRQSRIQRHLKRLNKPAITSFESPDGDTIDCVLLSQQPAFDHPNLKFHKIETEPTFPSGMEQWATQSKTFENNKSQLWHEIGKCPKGTIPIRRTKEKDLMRAKAFKDYGKKFHHPAKIVPPPGAINGLNENGHQTEPTFPSGMEQWETQSKTFENSKSQLWHEIGKCPKGTIPIRRTKEKDLMRAKAFKDYGQKFHHPAKIVPPPGVINGLNENGHQHAVAYVQGGSYYGAKAVMNVWEPSTEVPNEFSLSQIWVLAGSFQGDLNSIEAGWQSDAYHATGCYNLLCSGFVQISNEIAMGASISPVSTYSGIDISILIWKDPKQGNWWMQFGGSYVLGYWPSELFSSLAGSSTMIEWGGEVVNSSPYGQHTSTQMGSGHFPSEGFGRAAYFSHLQVVDADNNLRPPMDLSTFAESPNCYDVHNEYDTNWGDYFYYGGPGYNDNCS